MKTKEALTNELNSLIAKYDVQSHIVKHHELKSSTEICDELKISLAKFAANRLALGGVINEGGFIQLDKKKAKAVLKSHLNNISTLHKKIKNSASIQQEKKLAKEKNTYNNHEGFFKQEARDKMTNAIKEGPIGVVPSLPSYTGKLELQILDSIGKGFEFIGCERDFDTFHKLVNTIAENPKLRKFLKPRFCEIGEVIFNAKSDDFAHLILDYCGTINSFHKEIEYAIQNDLVKVNGTIAITLSKNGIGNNVGIVGELLRQFPQGCFGDDKETEMGVKLFLNKVMKPNYKVETFFNYYDSSPMMLIIIRRLS
jgi:hypothetical protein